MGSCIFRDRKKETRFDGASDKFDNEHVVVEVQEKGCSLGNGNHCMNSNRKTSTSNEALIDSIRGEVSNLLERISKFQGNSESDKNYRFLDEMLTRCILNLDKIKCQDSRDRGNRKQAISEVNQAISILERKLEINLDIKKLELNLADS